MAKEPKIIKTILDFFNAWENPDDDDKEYKTIKVHHLLIYSVSPNFVFKWHIPYNDLEEAAKFVGTEIKENKIFLSVGEYEIELQGIVKELS